MTVFTRHPQGIEPMPWGWMGASAHFGRPLVGFFTRGRLAFTAYVNLLLNPAAPANPEHKRSRVPISGTALIWVRV